MRVLFHCWEYPPVGGGVGTYMHQMATALVQQGHQAAVVTGRVEGLDEESVEEGVVISRRYSRTEAGGTKAADALNDMIAAFKPDVIEGADHLGECAPVLRAPHDVPVLVKAHTCQIVRVLQDAHIHYPWQRIIWRMARIRAHKQMRNEVDSIRKADFLTSPSRRLLDEMRHQGVALPKACGVVPNPIADPGAGRDESTHPTLLFVGRLEFLKGIAFLPGLLAEVRREYPDVRFELAGDDTYARGLGSLKAWLNRRWEGHEECVTFLGRLGDEALDAAYRRAWVVIAPSLWDNFPTVVLEAMIRGACVATTPHGGMPEMFSGTGVPTHDPASPAFADDVKAMLLDSGLRAKRGHMLRERCLHAYSPASVVSQYMKFLEGKIRVIPRRRVLRCRRRA